MAKSTKGSRRRTRSKMKKRFREKTTVNQFLEEFSEGEKVLIKIEPSSHRAMPHPRYKGKSGVIKGKRGNSYMVEISDGRLNKLILATPEHLRHLNKHLQ